MKKFFLSLIAVATLFSACSSDEVAEGSSEKGAGTLKATLSLSTDGKLKSTASTAVPVTSWTNIKQLHVFLYEKSGAGQTDGKVAFSYVLEGAALAAQVGNDKQYTWTNVPAGNYRLVIVANTGATDAIQGKVGATNINWTANTVVNKKFGSAVATDLYLDFKKAAAFPAPYQVYNTDPTPNVPYLVPSEIFTVYDDNVTITEGTTTTLGSPTSLKLKREVALFRTRINTSSPKVNLSKIQFNNANNFMLVQTLPVGLGLKTEGYAGGSFAASDVKKVLVAKTGANAFSSTPPTVDTHSNPTTILANGFSLWNEFVIFPNNTTGLNEALVGRKYNIVISAFAEAGYVAEDGVVGAGGANVYWDGVINEPFEPNVIREVDITITSQGTIKPPITPVPVGKLEITVGTPAPWDSNIKTTETEI